MMMEQFRTEAPQIALDRSPASARATAKRLPIAGALCDVVFWLFIAGLAWTPLWFGSNTLLAWGINAVIFPGLVLVLEITLLTCGLCHPVAWRVVALPFICVGAVIVFIVVQDATWTPHALHHPIWDMAALALDRPVAASISVNRDLTLQALIRLVTATSVFWLGLQLCRHSGRANRFMIAVTLIVTIYAGYGLFVRTVEPHAGGLVTSTFYNRNHFAAYAGMGLIVAAGLLLRLYRSAQPRAASWRMRAAGFLETTGRIGALHVSAVVVIAAALMLTGSRGGILSFVAGGLVLAFLMFGRRKGRGGEQIAMIGLVGLLVAAAFVVFGDAFFGKVEQLGLGDDARLAIYRLTIASILDAPFLGYGYGTFADVFPMVRDRSVDISDVWTTAHNTYLEVFQGLGLAFGTLLVLAAVLPALRCVSGAVTRRADATMPAVAAAVSCLIGLNALVDFSLQIQAVTLTFMAILGAGVAQSISSRIDLED